MVFPKTKGRIGPANYEYLKTDKLIALINSSWCSGSVLSLIVHCHYWWNNCILIEGDLDFARKRTLGFVVKCLRFRRIHICGFIHMLVVGAIGFSLDIVCVSLIPMQLHKYIVRWVGREKGHYPFPLDRTLALIMSAIQISSHVLQKVFRWRACPVRCRTETTALLFRRIAWNGPHLWLEDILEWHVAE